MAAGLTIQGLYIEAADLLIYAEARGRQVRWAVVRRTGEEIAAGTDRAPRHLHSDPGAAADRTVDRLAGQYAGCRRVRGEF